MPVLPDIAVTLGTTIDELAHRLATRVKDSSHADFPIATLHLAVREGIRRTFPWVYTEEFSASQTVAADAESIDITALLPSSDVYKIYDVQYQLGTGGRWISHGRWRYPGSGTTIYLLEPLTYARSMRVVWMVGTEEPASDTVGAIGLQGPLLDAVELFAAAWVLDGMLVGRQVYDKYTTVTSDDAVSAYDIQSAAKRFREEAEVLLRRHGRQPSSVVMR